MKHLEVLRSSVDFFFCFTGRATDTRFFACFPKDGTSTKEKYMATNGSRLINGYIMNVGRLRVRSILRAPVGFTIGIKGRNIRARGVINRKVYRRL